MTTLNRFPLLGLWAKEAARRIGYTKDESESLGHAYAILYAIRAQGPLHRKDEPEAGERPPPGEKQPEAQRLSFGGDRLEIALDERGHVRGLVGGGRPQTPATYRVSVRAKFPDGYYGDLEQCFRQLLRTYAPRTLDSRLIYKIYDRWKKECAVGRLVDLDELIAWCRKECRERATDLFAARPASVRRQRRSHAE